MVVRAFPPRPSILPAAGVSTDADQSVSLFACVVAVFGPSLRAAEPPLPKVVDFNRDIRPILSDNCYPATGRTRTTQGRPAARHQRRPLRRRQFRPVVPGKPDESDLYRRLVEKTKTGECPDGVRQKADAAADRARQTVDRTGQRRGRDTGRISSRCVPPCRRKRSRFIRTPIDRFILAKLREADLQARAEADRVTLIRRLSFDLTGLPPTPAEVDAFVADKPPDAYEKLVDRLLASPALRRAHGDVLARPGALRRLHRLPQRQPDERLAPTATTSSAAFNDEQALRPLHARAARRRPAAERDARAEGRLGVQPPAADDRGGRRAGEGVPGEVRGRPRAQRLDGLAGGDDGLLRVPRPQVRSVLDARLLRAGGVLRRHEGGRRRPARAGHAGADAGSRRELAAIDEPIAEAPARSSTHADAGAGGRADGVGEAARRPASRGRSLDAGSWPRRTARR